MLQKNLKIIDGVPHILCRFFIEPPPDATAEKKTEGGQEEGLRKRNMGFVYTVIWYAQTPPPPSTSPPILHVLPHLPVTMIIRTGGTVGRPPPATHTSFQQLETIAVDL
jgi:hypothetical protein